MWIARIAGRGANTGHIMCTRESGQGVKDVNVSAGQEAAAETGADRGR